MPPIEDTLYRYRIPLLGGILLVAVHVRFWSLGALPLWMDEASSVWFSDQSYGYLWSVVPRFENHPSLYYIVLKAWRGLAGSTEFALRTPSAIFGMGTVVCLFLAGRMLGAGLSGSSRTGWALGLVAAVVATFSQVQIAFSQEARPYAMACFGVAAMLAGTLRIVTAPTPGEGVRSLGGSAGLVAGMALTLWSHVLGLLAAGLTGLFLVAWWLTAARADRGVFLRLAAMAGLVILIALPHLWNTLAQSARDYSGFWLSAPDFTDLVRTTVRAVGLPGLPGGAKAQLPIAAILLLLGVAGLWRMGGATPHHRTLRTAVFGLLMLLSAGFWAVLVLYTFLVQPVFLLRTLIFLQPPALLMLAAAPWALDGRRRAGLAALVVVLVAMAAFGTREVQVYDRMPRAIAERIHAETPDAPILALAGDSQQLLGYYDDRLGLGLDIRPIPAPFPFMRDGLPDFISRPVVDREMADAAVATLGAEPVVWLVMRRSHFADSGMALRASLAASGRIETVVFGGRPSDHMSALRFDLE